MPALPARIVLLFALYGTGAAAAEVYKCTTQEGAVAFQDQPCAAGAEQARVHVADVADDAAAAPTPAPPPQAVPAAPAFAPPTPRPSKPLPRIWLCTNAEDGSHYASRNGPPPPRAVPLGILGYPGKSLAQAYGPGSNVMSAPELSHPPIDTSPQAAMATSYTELQDTCIRADVQQTCDYLRQQLDATRDQLSRARFKDEDARLQPQVDALEGDLGGC